MSALRLDPKKKYVWRGCGAPEEAFSFCGRDVVIQESFGGGGEAAIIWPAMATQFIEQGHVRVGPELITDPAFLVTRNMEDFVTWVDTSKIRQHVMENNEARDNYDLA